MLGVFGYSQEPGTAAARLPGQLPEEVKQARRAELMEAQQRIVFQRNADLIGGETTVLADRWAGPDVLVCRSTGQAPEVDSVTLLPISRASQSHPQPGQFVPVRITGYRGYDLLAATIP